MATDQLLAQDSKQFTQVVNKMNHGPMCKPPINKPPPPPPLPPHPKATQFHSFLDSNDQSISPPPLPPPPRNTGHHSNLIGHNPPQTNPPPPPPPPPHPSNNGTINHTFSNTNNGRTQIQNSHLPNNNSFISFETNRNCSNPIDKMLTPACQNMQQQVTTSISPFSSQSSNPVGRHFANQKSLALAGRPQQMHDLMSSRSSLSSHGSNHNSLAQHLIHNQVLSKTQGGVDNCHHHHTQCKSSNMSFQDEFANNHTNGLATNENFPITSNIEFSHGSGQTPTSGSTVMNVCGHSNISDRCRDANILSYPSENQSMNPQSRPTLSTIDLKNHGTSIDSRNNMAINPIRPPVFMFNNGPDENMQPIRTIATHGQQVLVNVNQNTPSLNGQDNEQELLKNLPNNLMSANRGILQSYEHNQNHCLQTNHQNSSDFQNNPHVRKPITIGNNPSGGNTQRMITTTNLNNRIDCIPIQHIGQANSTNNLNIRQHPAPVFHEHHLNHNHNANQRNDEDNVLRTQQQRQAQFQQTSAQRVGSDNLDGSDLLDPNQFVNRLPSTHSHNLSNSSTTTHTSNIALKQPIQQQRFQNNHSGITTMSDEQVTSLAINNIGSNLINRGQSQCNQPIDQYNSSAASTSSATASLSSFNIRGLSDDAQSHWTIDHRSRQPIPPPPMNPLPNATMIRSRPTTLTNRISKSTTIGTLTNIIDMKKNNQDNVNISNSNQHMSNMNNVKSSKSIPIMTTTFLDTSQTNGQCITAGDILPPLPPRPNSPNTSTCSTQLTTLANSPERITRVTSQAGVQNPLPSSDIPPPLPPTNSRGVIVTNGQASSLTNNLMDRSIGIMNNGINQANKFLPAASSQRSMGTLMSQSYNDSNDLSDTLNKNLNINNESNEVFFRRRIEVDQQSTNRLFPQQHNHQLRRLNHQDTQQQTSNNLTSFSDTSSNLGTCAKCNNIIRSSQGACKAMDRMYHVHCFTCCRCNKTLKGQKFHPLGNKIFCEEDFSASSDSSGHDPDRKLDLCNSCSEPIDEIVLAALGKYYHPECFRCCTCGLCLDGIQFTIDTENKIYCIKDYHRCAACMEIISPVSETGETVRIVSMDKDYHIDCYFCQDCGLQLSDDEPSQAYPLKGQLLCQQCHIKRLANCTSR